jgi:hypothetical protein
MVNVRGKDKRIIRAASDSGPPFERTEFERWFDHLPGINNHKREGNECNTVL